jgi:hypothetical protein
MFSFPSLALQPHWQVRRGDSDTDSGAKEEEEEHLDKDFTVQCPLSGIPEKKCMWGGDLVGLQDHVEEVHTDVQMPGPWFHCVSVTNTVLLVRCFEELFLYYKYFSRSGLMYTFVQQIGLTSKDYRYAIYLFSHNELVDSINYSFRMTKFSVPIKAILLEKRCMVIDISFLEYFRLNGGIEMLIRIEESDDQIGESDVTVSKGGKRKIPRTPPQK